MADSGADSTNREEENEDGNRDNSSKVSTTSEVTAAANDQTSPALNSTAISGTSPSSTSSDNQQKNDSSVIQPSKLGSQLRPGFTAFGGTGTNSGTFSSNPFGPQPTLKNDVVSTANQHPQVSEGAGLIAPSRFSANPFLSQQSDSQVSSQSDPDSDPCSGKDDSKVKFLFRPSRLADQVEALKKNEASSASVPPPSILRPATLPDPRQQPEQDKTSNSTDVMPSKSEANGNPVSNASSADDLSEVSSTNQQDSSRLSRIAEAAPVTEKVISNGYSSQVDSTSTGATSNNDNIFCQSLTSRVTSFAAAQMTSNDTAAGARGFTFGQNLTDRVVFSHSSVEEAEKNSDGDDRDSSDAENANRTLEESAREYQAKHGLKPDLKEVEIVTGEEEESNVLQVCCKLFLFDGDKQVWVEKGRGTLRLNDTSPEDTAEAFNSRLIMRTQGSLRLILNTKIWPGMTVERASQKSVRITATDGVDGIKVFLITSNPKDSETILRAIDWRIQQLKLAEEKEQFAKEERVSEKRKADSTDAESPKKKQKISLQSEGVTPAVRREESDSSVQDPETEASCESFSSSFTVKSESD
ncbi:ran-binding protein 3-like [Gigantopelta aegis]|uniref:ran-binding protein 3-like n=1 Tax=Gigantopelta aegis TaxID=1735272 RepID=UPI001B88C52B|nr:ran-binding protein 3-like [Gigantopelta aegis]